MRRTASQRAPGGAVALERLERVGRARRVEPAPRRHPGAEHPPAADRERHERARSRRSGRVGVALTALASRAACEELASHGARARRYGHGQRLRRRRRAGTRPARARRRASAAATAARRRRRRRLRAHRVARRRGRPRTRPAAALARRRDVPQPERPAPRAGAPRRAPRRSHGRGCARSGAEALAAALTPASEHRAAAAGAHPVAEAVLLLPLAVVGLERALHAWPPRVGAARASAPEVGGDATGRRRPQVYGRPRGDAATRARAAATSRACA